MDNSTLPFDLYLEYILNLYAVKLGYRPAFYNIGNTKYKKRLNRFVDEHGIKELKLTRNSINPKDRMYYLITKKLINETDIDDTRLGEILGFPEQAKGDWWDNTKERITCEINVKDLDDNSEDTNKDINLFVFVAPIKNIDKDNVEELTRSLNKLCKGYQSILNKIDLGNELKSYVNYQVHIYNKHSKRIYRNLTTNELIKWLNTGSPLKAKNGNYTFKNSSVI